MLKGAPMTANKNFQQNQKKTKQMKLKSCVDKLSYTCFFLFFLFSTFSTGKFEVQFLLNV